jgi:hypothetical protein
MSSAKRGMQPALADSQNNHPNDIVSVIRFSRPAFNTSDWIASFSSA